MEKVTTATGKKWPGIYQKEYKNEDMFYLGIEFNEEINLPESLTSEGRVF